MNKTTKRHLISAGITFISAFLLAFASNLSVDSLDRTAIFSLCITATRAGIKGLAEILPKLFK